MINCDPTEYTIVYCGTILGSLTLAEKELIIVATSAANNCLYCVVSRGAMHRILSRDSYKADQVGVENNFPKNNGN